MSWPIKTHGHVPEHSLALSLRPRAIAAYRQVVDIVLAASARSFISKALDGLGAQADAEYLTDPVLSRAASFPR
ncbi:MAG TPA: hypothetical protein VMQ78_05955 [Candidatus Limnocylindria bacterium]|nr:hypothetical protein [Candidatus Limnocylindria bacterium]